MSSYLVLARKYRPKTFAEVIGQESVTEVLKGAIEEGRLGHAYLFAGPRGTGKTTTARILAKCLNCEEGPTATPCGTCDRCRGADEGSEVDIIELDAASHTGVDTIRELRDEVAYAPMRARHKVYIVDEVHMLSKAAFNALLKTLEEPPEHVVFLFATTEPHKVLDTILSRCQVMRLSPLSEERIEARLDEVFRREGVEAEPGVTRELARAARGGMRDALSMADKLLALAADKPTLADLDRLGGDGGARRLGELLDAVEQGDRKALIEILEGIGEDEDELAAGILEQLRISVVARHCGADAPFLSATEEERAAALARAERLGPERLELWMAELLRARERMRLLPDQARLVLETTLLDLARPETTIPLTELLTRLEALEAGSPAPAPRMSSPVEPASAPSPGSPDRAPARSTPTPKPASGAAAPAGTARLADRFAEFLEVLGRTHAAMAELLGTHASPQVLEEEGEGVLTVRLATLTDKERKLVSGRRNLHACSQAYTEVAGRPVEFRILTPDAQTPVSDAKASARSRARARPASQAPSPELRPAAPPATGAPTTPPRRDDPSGPATPDLFAQKTADRFDGMIEDIS
ncbi:MAG TPA: DNA polymerase III subunit gamma/tau [Planctomycetes bacterium]|nr:DNA polymerase III subunit gamma/tau [Planctomycetota bacterium]